MRSCKMDAVVKVLADRVAIAKERLKPNPEAEALAVLAATRKGYRFAYDQALTNIKIHEKAKKAVLRNGITIGANVHSVDWSPDGRLLAIASMNNAIQIWDPATGQVVNTLEGHTAPVHCVAWSPSGTFLVSASEDRTTRTWNVASASLIQTEHHADPVLDVAWSPDERFLMSGCGNRTIRIWEASTGRCVKVVEGERVQVFDVAWSPDGRFFASTSDSANGNVHLWDANTNQMIKTLSGHSNWVAGVVWKTDPESPPDIIGWTAVMAWSPDGRFLATGSWDKSICIWDVATGAIVHRLVGHADLLTCVAWSPDGRFLASTAKSSPMFLWDVMTGQIIKKVNERLASITSIAWSPDGAFLAAWRPHGHFLRNEQGGDDQTVRIWYVPDLF